VHAGFEEEGPVRDPARINRILVKLKEVWIVRPDLRLGQLVMNFDFDDLYQVEDDVMEMHLDSLIKTGKWD
jgi:hypothetical protein